MSWAFGKYGKKKKKNAYMVWWRHLKEGDHLEDPCIDGGDSKKDGRTLTGFIWLWIGTVGGLF